MSLIIWSDSLNVGVKILDEQHEKLFDYVNTFYSKLYSNNNRENLNQILTDLYNFTYFHFQTEEKLLKKISYPDIENHKNDHDAFLSNLVAYQNLLKINSLNLSMEIINYLKNSIIHHILISDKPLAEYILKKNITLALEDLG